MNTTIDPNISDPTGSIASRLAFHPLWLFFSDRQMEMRFLADIYRSNLVFLRIILILGAALFGVFGLLDLYLVPDHLPFLWFLRFLVVCPMILSAFVFTYLWPHGTWLRMYIVACIIVAGMAITMMTVVLPPPVSNYYYAGLILCVIYCSATSMLRFVQSILAIAALIIVYILALVLFDAAPIAVAVSNSFFLIGSGCIGGFAAYTIERYWRRDFTQRMIIEHEHELLKDMNLRLKEIATTDPLTGLHNRRHLDVHLKEAVRLHSRYGTLTTAVLIDLDNFKRVNDVLGHLAGDELLQKFANMLTDRVRSTDKVFRYGGDEFLILMPNTRQDGAIIFAKRLQRDFQLVANDFDMGKLNVGASVGVAPIYSTGNGDVINVLRVVDDALLKAKNSGKGRIHICYDTGK